MKILSQGQMIAESLFKTVQVFVRSQILQINEKYRAAKQQLKQREDLMLPSLIIEADWISPLWHN